MQTTGPNILGYRRISHPKSWGVGEDELASFLSHLSVRSGREGLDELQGRCSWAMRSVGYRPAAGALLGAIGALRKLIRTDVREVDAEAIRLLVGELNLVSGKPPATLLVQSLRPDPWPETATAAVDWIDLLHGDDPICGPPAMRSGA